MSEHVSNVLFYPRAKINLYRGLLRHRDVLDHTFAHIRVIHFCTNMNRSNVCLRMTKWVALKYRLKSKISPVLTG